MSDKYRDSFFRLYGRQPVDENEFKFYCHALHLRVGVLKKKWTHVYVDAQLGKFKSSRDHYLEIVKREFANKGKPRR